MHRIASFKASAPRQLLHALLYLLHPWSRTSCIHDSRAHAPYLHPVGKASFELLSLSFLESKACFGRLSPTGNYDAF
jgi:hypothetical protein